MPVMLDKKRKYPVRPKRYEVVFGEVQELPENGAYCSCVANDVLKHLSDYEHSRDNGRARSAMLYEIPLPEDPTRIRRPAVAYVSFARWPLNQPISYYAEAVSVVPELVVEVASPTDSGDKLFDKADEYLRGGVLVVWVIFPRAKTAMIYETGKDVRVVRNGGSLDGGTVFPDLTVPLAGLFPPVIND